MHFSFFLLSLYKLNLTSDFFMLGKRDDKEIKIDKCIYTLSRAVQICRFVSEDDELDIEIIEKRKSENAEKEKKFHTFCFSFILSYIHQVFILDRLNYNDSQSTSIFACASYRHRCTSGSSNGHDVLSVSYVGSRRKYLGTFYLLLIMSYLANIINLCLFGYLQFNHQSSLCYLLCVYSSFHHPTSSTTISRTDMVGM